VPPLVGGILRRYIEWVKTGLQNAGSRSTLTMLEAPRILFEGFDALRCGCCIRSLPFLTEELCTSLPDRRWGEVDCLVAYPEASGGMKDCGGCGGVWVD